MVGDHIKMVTQFRKSNISANNDNDGPFNDEQHDAVDENIVQACSWKDAEEEEHNQ